MCGARRPAADKPNLLFIWTDQQRADTLAAYGNSRFKVPVLNRLAEQSIVFLKTYDTQPVCTPARSSVMTGLWPHTNGCIGNNIPLSRQTLTMSELLGDPAYRTGYMGKWHLGDEVFAQHGFQEWVSIEDQYIKYYAESRDKSARSSYCHFLEKLGYKPEREDGAFSRNSASHLPIEHCKPAFLAREASQFVTRHRSEPWMLYVNFLEPHSPFSGPLNDLHGEEDVRLPAGYPGTPVDNEPELYRARRTGKNKKGKKEREDENEPVTSRDALIRKCRNYAGLCSQVDQAVGRILQALETSGQAERTIIVFTSDHGEMMGSHSLSGKNVLYEDAVRIPLLIRVPFRQQEPIRVSRPVSHIDLAPTLLELMGRSAPAFLQGESLMPLVEGGKRREEDVFIEWHTVPDGPHARTIVSPDGWKLVLFDRDHCLLFNHNKDPLEMQNLYYRSDFAQTSRRLQSRLEAWQRRTGDRLVLSSS